MSVDETIKIISTLGFPVVMCLLLYYNMVQQDKRHENENRAMQETLNRNTNVLTELSTLIKTLIK